MELKLTADTESEERVLDYLRGNVSESLAERINAGSKTFCEREIYCPWCGEINDDFEMREAYEDGTHVIKCDECGNEFTLETSISYSYSTSKKLPKWFIDDRKREAEARNCCKNQIR